MLQNDIRQRNISQSGSKANINIKGSYYVEEGYYHNKEIKFPISSSYLVFILILMVTVFVAVIVIEKKLPPGLKLSEERRHPNRYFNNNYNCIDTSKNVSACGDFNVKVCFI